MRKIAITGIRKAAETVGNYLKHKTLRGVARTNRTAGKVADAAESGIASYIRGSRNVRAAAIKGGRRLMGEVDKVAGPIGKATRDASAKVVKAGRHLRPRARETMGQIARRKGWVNKKYTPSEKYTHGMRNDRMRNNINFRDESVRPNRGGDYMSNSRPPREMNMREIKAPDNIGDYQKYYKAPAFDRSKLSYDEIKPMGRGPRYSSKQVKAGRRVIAGGLAVGGAVDAYNSYRNQKRNSR
jgi:hypothetical protein